MVGPVLYGADEEVAAMVAARIPHARDGFGQSYNALGVVRKGILLGGVVYHNYRGHDIEVSAAFDSPRYASRETLRQFFSYPFIQLRCRRITTITARNNKRARRMDEYMGFKLEGVARKALDGEQDAMVYGMLREECRWINGE